MVADVANLGAKSANYYLREVAETRELYYSGHGEAPGVWVGSASARLGLIGQVSPEQFKAMFQGRNPVTGEQLGKATSASNGRPAFDLVLRPVKSVSVLWGLGDERVQHEVMEAHRFAVSEALKPLEREVGTRRGAGGRTRIDAQGFLAARYDHRTSRAGDPLLHSHVIIANRVQGVDGKWGTIHGTELYHEAMSASAVYGLVMRGQLTNRLGVDWVVSERTGQVEIKGMPDRVIRDFSKRREEIELAMETHTGESGEWNPKVAEWVAHETRPEKVEVGEHTLRSQWAGRESVQGLDVAAMLGQARELTDQERERAALFERLAGDEGVTKDSATFDLRDVREAIHDAGPTQAMSDQDVQQLAEAFVRESGQVARVAAPGKPLYTTVAQMELEQRLVRSAQGRAGEGVGIVAAANVRAAVEAAATLGRDQEAAVRQIAGDGQGVSALVGPAGSGKTTTLRTVNDAFQRQGMTVVGAAPTGIAAQELEHGAGIEARTIDSLLGSLDRDAILLGPRHLLVVDEAGMVGTPKMVRLLDHAQAAGAKVVLAGDDRQLQAVRETGGGFRALRQRLGAAELTENRRQHDPLDRQALALIREGKGEQAMRLYAASGKVQFAADQATADTKLLRDWWQSFAAGEDAAMLTLTRDDAARLNAQARDVMRADGRLGTASIAIGADRDDGGIEVAQGDKVVCRVNAPKSLGVSNGTRGWVEAIDTQRGSILLRTDDDQRISLPASYLRKTGSQGSPALNLGYASTTHRTQAMTIDKAFVRQGGSGTTEWWYVGLSRAREVSQVYAVAREPETRDGIEMTARERVDPATTIAHGMQRSEGKTLAIDTGAAQPVGHMTVAELRAERRQLAEDAEKAPKDRRLELGHYERQLQAAEAHVKARRDAEAAARAVLEETERQPLWRRLAALREAREQLATARGALQAAQDGADRAEDRLRPVRAAQQARGAWTERNADMGGREADITRELALRKRLDLRAMEIDPPAWLKAEIGQPTIDMSAERRKAWRDAAAQVDRYRSRYRVTDPERALGERPAELSQRAEYRRAERSMAPARGEEAAARAVGQDRAHEPGREPGREVARGLDRARGFSRARELRPGLDRGRDDGGLSR